MIWERCSSCFNASHAISAYVSTRYWVRVLPVVNLETASGIFDLRTWQRPETSFPACNIYRRKGGWILISSIFALGWDVDGLTNSHSSVVKEDLF